MYYRCKAKLIIYPFFLFSLSSVVSTFLHLQASPRFPVHLTQQPARTVLTGVEAWLWHPSFPSRSHSRAAGQALPAQQEEGGYKVEVSIWPPASVGKFWLQLVTLSTLPVTLEDNQPWWGPVLFRKSSWLRTLDQIWKNYLTSSFPPCLSPILHPANIFSPAPYKQVLPELSPVVVLKTKADIQ